MTSDPPTVSVVIAAYNGAAIIAETLDSLIAQTFDDFEVIVVNDASTDETASVVRAYGDPRIRLIDVERNGGCVRARNIGFAAARGRYIAGLDHDDPSLPERFARQVAYLDSHPDTVLVGTGSMLLEKGAIRPHPRASGMSPGLIDWMMLTRNPLVWSSVMFRADAARRLDPFQRLDRHYAEDFDLYHRLRPYGRIAEIPERLVLYRIDPNSMSHAGIGRMLTSVTRLLAERHADLLGIVDLADTRRIVRHVAAREPVPDDATLAAVFAMVERLHAAFLERNETDEAQRAEIRWDISRLWWQLCRTAVRSGAVPLRRAIASRPKHVSGDRRASSDLLVSGVVGQARAMRAKAGNRRAAP